MGPDPGSPAANASDSEFLQYVRDLENNQRTPIENEFRFDAIMQGSPIPQFVIDRNHHVIFWNRALEVHSRIPAGEVLGTNRHWRAFYPAERPCLADLIVDSAIEQIPVWYGGKCNPSKLVEGSYEGVDFFSHLGESGAWLFFTAAPIRDDSGTVIGAVETLEDITGRRRAEEALRESEQRYRSITEAVTDYIYTVRVENGRSVETRHGTACVVVTGYTQEEFARDPNLWLRMVVEDDRYVVEDQARRVLEGTGAPAIEHRIIRKDGAARWVRNTPVPCRDEQGRLTSYDGLVQDITERKCAEEALHEAIRKLNLLSDITRHDILNQLTVIRGYLDLTKELVTDPRHRELVEKEETAAETIQRQIEFTRDYQELGIKAPLWHDVRKVFEEASRNVTVERVTVITETGDFEIYADPLLERVFYNLVENAIRHGGNLTKIVFSSRETENGLMLICIDDGCGIPLDQKENIFQRKYFKHTGFGLFLSREILAITGLCIRENGEPGRGARFEITVPKTAYRRKQAG